MSGKNISDGLIDKWAEEAMADLGEQGWRGTCSELFPNGGIRLLRSIIS